MMKIRLRALDSDNVRDGVIKDIYWPTVPRVGDVLEYDPERMGIATVMEVWHFPFCREDHLIEVKFAIPSAGIERLEELGWDAP